MDLARLSAILETVPETHLDIFELMWELTDEDGKFDDRKVNERPLEVGRAVSQVKEYVRTVQALNRILVELCSEPKL